MQDIRNGDGHLVCRIDEANCAIEICIKGCLTRIQWTPGGKIRIAHTRKALLTA